MIYAEEVSGGGDNVIAVMGRESGFLRGCWSSGIARIALWTESVLSWTNVLSC